MKNPRSHRKTTADAAEVAVAAAAAKVRAEGNEDRAGGPAPVRLRLTVAAIEPVRVVPYNPRWPRLFEAERKRVEAVVGAWARSVEHIGSTAVPGLDAKPVIDLLVGVQSMRDADLCVSPLEEIGYAYWADDPVPHRRYLVRFADAERTARTHNLHVVEAGSVFGRERLLFRDYLRAYPETAREYARLKYELAAHFRDDREAYTAAKTYFVKDVLERAT